MQRLVWVWLWALVGCTPELDDCNADSECSTGRQCISGLCVRRADAGADATLMDMASMDEGLPDSTAPEAGTPDALRDATPDRPIDDLGAPADAARDALTDVAVDAAVDAGPSPEAQCNDQDDDGDGRIDEGFDVGAPCMTGVGACATEGVRVCSADEATVCDVDAVRQPGTEVCTLGDADPVDEDCDGRLDEAIGRLAPVGDGEVGLQNNVPEGERTLDVAMSAQHTVVLARFNDDGLRAVVFARGGEANGSIARLAPFDDNGFQAQIARAGEGFAFAAISAANPSTVQLALLTWNDAGEPQIIRESTGFAHDVGRLVLVPSPEGQATIFVHGIGQQEVVRRDLTNQLMGNRTRRLTTPNYRDNPPFAATAQGDESHVLWQDDSAEAPVLVLRRFDNEQVRANIPMPVPTGIPLLIRRAGDVIPGSLTADAIVRYVLGQRTLRLTGTRALPDAAPLHDGAVLLAALGNGGGVLRLYDNELRNSQSTNFGDAVGRLHTASAERTAAVVWRGEQGRVMIRAVRFDCR